MVIDLLKTRSLILFGRFLCPLETLFRVSEQIL